MRESTKDKIKGKAKEVSGKIKEKAGRSTGDPDMADRGRAEQVGGKVQNKVGQIKRVFEK